VKEIYKMSRKDAHTLIQANKGKINHTNVDNPATQLLEDDLISVRKYGRSKLVEESGKTRKDKHKITVAILKTSKLLKVLRWLLIIEKETFQKNAIAKKS